MQLKTKALIHYIINTTVILITVGALVLSPLAYQSTSELLDTFGISFGIMAAVALISLMLTTFIFANDHTKPLRILLPLFLSIILYALLAGIITSPYNTFFDGVYSEAFSEKPWASIGMIILAIVFILLIMIINTFSTRFLLISMSGNRAAEWEISNYEALIYNKATIKHNNNFSYLYNNNKLIITRFITEDVIERTLIFEPDETTTKSNIVIEIEKETERVSSKLDIPVFGSITYLSNKLPELQGSRSKGFIVTKNNQLFSNFKKIPKDRTIDLSKIEEVIK